jgi:hypothetical protein
VRQADGNGAQRPVLVPGIHPHGHRRARTERAKQQIVRCQTEIIVTGRDRLAVSHSACSMTGCTGTTRKPRPGSPNTAGFPPGTGAANAPPPTSSIAGKGPAFRSLDALITRQCDQQILLRSRARVGRRHRNLGSSRRHRAARTRPRRCPMTPLPSPPSGRHVATMVGSSHCARGSVFTCRRQERPRRFPCSAEEHRARPLIGVVNLCPVYHDEVAFEGEKVVVHHARRVPIRPPFGPLLAAPKRAARFPSAKGNDRSFAGLDGLDVNALLPSANRSWAFVPVSRETLIRMPCQVPLALFHYARAGARGSRQRTVTEVLRGNSRQRQNWKACGAAHDVPEDCRPDEVSTLDQQPVRPLPVSTMITSMMISRRIL